MYGIMLQADLEFVDHTAKAAVSADTRASPNTTEEAHMRGIIYLVGLVVIVLAIVQFVL